MKSYNIKFTPEAARLTAKLHPDNKKMIKTGLKTLQENPNMGGDLQEELSGFKSYKLKRYRIIYRMIEDENVINIYYIGHIRDVYEQFQIYLNIFRSSVLY